MADKKPKKFKQFQLKKPKPFVPENVFQSQANDFREIRNKKMYIYHTLVGSEAATAANYDVFANIPVDGYVSKITEVHTVVGSDGGAVELNIEVLESGQALDAGTALLGSPFSLKSTINTPVDGTLSTVQGVLAVNIGDRLAMDDNGTLTAVSNVSIIIEITY